MKRAGVTDIISLSACGSLREDLPPGSFVRVSQFIDRTFAREKSFFGTGLVAHVSMAKPVCGRLGDHLAAGLAELRRRPRVASVTDRSAMVQSFRDTMAQSLSTFTFAITLLAGAVAVGVVYNAARITLAERGRELASLRVLGYTRAEVRGLLLGELGALALMALLPGFVLGFAMIALLARGMQSDLFRIPVVPDPTGVAFAGLVILAATVLSGALVRRRLDRLDLVAALKTKE